MVRLYGKVDFSIIDGDLYCANGCAKKIVLYGHDFSRAVLLSMSKRR